jgi:hypothetical protein
MKNKNKINRGKHIGKRSMPIRKKPIQKGVRPIKQPQFLEPQTGCVDCPMMGGYVVNPDGLCVCGDMNGCGSGLAVGESIGIACTTSDDSADMILKYLQDLGDGTITSHRDDCGGMIETCIAAGGGCSYMGYGSCNNSACCAAVRECVPCGWVYTAAGYWCGWQCGAGGCPYGQSMGCDGVCSANALYFDWCGICGGDGSSCWSEDDWPSIDMSLGRLSFPYWGCINAVSGCPDPNGSDCEWACCAGRGQCHNVSSALCSNPAMFKNSTWTPGKYCNSSCNVDDVTNGTEGLCDCNNNAWHATDNPDGVTCDDLAGSYSSTGCGPQGTAPCPGPSGGNRTCCESSTCSELASCESMGLVGGNWPACTTECSTTITIEANPNSDGNTYLNGDYIIDSGLPCPYGCLYDNEVFGGPSGWCNPQTDGTDIGGEHDGPGPQGPQDTGLGVAADFSWSNEGMLATAATICKGVGGGGNYISHTEITIPPDAGWNGNTNLPIGSVWRSHPTVDPDEFQCYAVDGHNMRVITSVTCCSCEGALAKGGRTRPSPRGRGRKFKLGGRTCGGMNQPPCPDPDTGGIYRRGGRTRPAPRGRGGVSNQNIRAVTGNMQGTGDINMNRKHRNCRVNVSKYDCDKNANCVWNFSDRACQ